jgi:PAS domain S-box-containing protein
VTRHAGGLALFALLRWSGAAIGGLLGLLVLAGWAFQVEALKTGLTGGVATMKPHTALGLVLGALALLLADAPARHGRRLARVSAAGVTLIGLLALAGHALGTAAAPGRMAPGTAFCLASLGLAQSLALAAHVRSAQAVALTVVAVSGLALLGHLYSPEQLHQVAAYTTMALHTASGLALLGLATLFVHPAGGLLAGLTSATPVGQLGRRLLLMAVVAPTVLGWFGARARRAGLYGPEFGVAVLVGATLAVMAGTIWLGVRAGVRLDEDRQRLALIVESTADAIITSRLDGTITSWNAAAERLYGFTAAEAVGASMDLIVPLERRMEIRERVQLLLAGQELPPHDTVRLRQDGTTVDVHLTLSAVRSPTGAVVGVSAIARDVTERTRSQRALLDASRFNEQIVRSAAEGILVLDRDLHYVLWSPSLEAMTGLRAEEVLGRHPADLFPYLRESEAMRGLYRSLHGAVVNLSDVEAIHPRTQAPLWVSTHSAPLRSADGEIVGVLVTVIDITERRQAEEAQRALARRVLSAQEDERRRVARELHDQVGQILTSIKIQLAGVARVKTVEEVKPRVQAATEQVDVAIGQVRDLSRGLRPPQLDDLGLVPTLRWYVGQRAAESGVEIGLESHLRDLRLGPDEEMACFRVAQEAITNALRHARPTRLMVELERSEEALSLSVRDDGAGFDLPSLGRRAAAGECLGLTSMRERVSLCGGSLEVTSAPGRGTLVRALIPLVRRGPAPGGAPA